MKGLALCFHEVYCKQIGHSKKMHAPKWEYEYFEILNSSIYVSVMKSCTGKGVK